MQYFSECKVLFTMHTNACSKLASNNVNVVHCASVLHDEVLAAVHVDDD